MIYFYSWVMVNCNQLDSFSQLSARRMLYQNATKKLLIMFLIIIYI